MSSSFAIHMLPTMNSYHLLLCSNLFPFSFSLLTAPSQTPLRCHLCKTQDGEPGDYTKCAFCPLVYCKNCFSETNAKKFFVCPVCLGTCPCSECDAFPWKGHFASASDDGFRRYLKLQNKKAFFFNSFTFLLFASI